MKMILLKTNAKKVTIFRNEETGKFDFCFVFNASLNSNAGKQSKCTRQSSSKSFTKETDVNITRKTYSHIREQMYPKQYMNDDDDVEAASIVVVVFVNALTILQFYPIISDSNQFKIFYAIAIQASVCSLRSSIISLEVRNPYSSVFVCVCVFFPLCWFVYSFICLWFFFLSCIESLVF